MSNLAINNLIGVILFMMGWVFIICGLTTNKPIITLWGAAPFLIALILFMSGIRWK